MDIYQAAGLTGRDGFETDRLSIRPFHADHTAPLATALADTRITRFMPGLPTPYQEADARNFVSAVLNHGTRDWSVWRDNDLIGGLSLNDELGFWLHPNHWGQGLGFEMCHALLSRWFSRPEAFALHSSHDPRNTSSARLQARLGFAPRAPQSDGFTQTMLAPEQWHLLNPWVIETDRLRIAPLETRHAAEFAKITGVPEIARMTGSMRIGWGADEVASWINIRRWRGIIGFVHGIWLKETDALIGQVGMGGSPSDIGYVVAPAHWGHGYATEAVRAMLDAAIPRFELAEVVATVFQDNPASVRVLKNNGFEFVFKGDGYSAARDAKAPTWKYIKRVN